VTTSATIDNLPVTRIGDFAFSGLSSLTNIMVVNNLTCSGDLAFSACSSPTRGVEFINVRFRRLDSGDIGEFWIDWIIAPGSPARSSGAHRR